MAHPLWRDHRPDRSVVRGPESASEQAIEQDRAAGGRHLRLVQTVDGATPRASVRLVLPPRSRRIYAYLVFKHGGRNVTRYVGDASADTRKDALAKAWATIRAKGLLEPPPAQERDLRRRRSSGVRDRT